jgi:hypothetical protein
MVGDHHENGERPEPLHLGPKAGFGPWYWLRAAVWWQPLFSLSTQIDSLAHRQNINSTNSGIFSCQVPRVAASSRQRRGCCRVQKFLPRKNNPGESSATPRCCRGSAPPSSSSGSTPAEVIPENPCTRSRSRRPAWSRSARTGLPSSTPVTRGTSRTPDAARSLVLVLIRGAACALKAGCCLASHRRVEVEDVQAEEAHHRQHEAGRCPAVLHRQFATRLSRNGGGMRPAHFEGDLRPGVSQPHHQDRTRPAAGRDSGSRSSGAGSWKVPTLPRRREYWEPG